MGVLAQLANGSRDLERARTEFATFNLDEFGRWLQENGILTQSSLQSKVERVESNFPALLSGAYKANSAVFALEMVRLLLFSEARFQFRQMRNGQPGDLFGTAELALLEKPWANAVTGDMLARLILYADFAGNAFAVRRPGRTGPVIRLPRPDWMTIIVGTPEEALLEFEPDIPFWDLDAELIGYQYHPGGIGNGRPVNLLPEEVAHFAPVPDPIARFIGMSIWRAALTEIDGDNAATAMKLAYFSNGATPGTVVTINNPSIKEPEDLKTWIDLFEEDHKGATNRYRTLYLANGADVKVVGSNLQEADLSKTQGAMETRLAAAAGIHPALAGFSEGLGGSSLNKGNIQELKRLAADKTFRPYWRNVAGSLATLLNVPGGSELWYDDRGIAFLAEDVKEAADILFVKAQAIKQLTDAGYQDTSVVDAVTSGDLSRLQHTGLFSVQLQKPGSAGSDTPDTPIPPTAVSARAQRTFWTTGGLLSGRIIEGTCVRLDSPWVASFPSMFEPSEQALPVEVRISRADPLIAIPSHAQSLGDEVRCSNTACGKLLAEAVRGYYRGTCYRCKTVTEIDGRADSERSSAPIVDVRPFTAAMDRVAELVLDSRTRASEQPLQIIRVEAPAQVDIAGIVEAARAQAPDFGPLIDAILASRSEPSDVHFGEGAFHVEVHAPEPAQLSIAEGAVRVEVNAPPMSIERGAIQVDVQPAEPANVNIGEGAVRVVEHKLTRTVFDRDANKKLIGHHEEPLE